GQARREVQPDLVEPEIGALLGGGLRELAQHDQPGQRWQRARAPDLTPRSERLRNLGRERERETLVAARRVIVRAHVLVAGVADEHRAGHELEAAAARLDPEAAPAHVRDREGAVLLDVGLVRGARTAAVVGRGQRTAPQRGGARHPDSLAVRRLVLRYVVAE